MRGFLAAVAVSALMFSTAQAAGSERSPKRSAYTNVSVQVPSSHRAAISRKTDVGRQFSATSNFRAEDLIPDICKGCSS